MGNRGTWVERKGWQDIRGLVGESRERTSEVCKRRKDDIQNGAQLSEPLTQPSSTQNPSGLPAPVSGSEINLPSNTARSVTSLPPQIFRSLTFYLSGSTHSSGISDPKLKSLFVQHGGSISIAPARRTVTHVDLDSEGGGLAASKIQKEVAKWQERVCDMLRRNGW